MWVGSVPSDCTEASASLTTRDRAAVSDPNPRLPRSSVNPQLGSVNLTRMVRLCGPLPCPLTHPLHLTPMCTLPPCPFPPCTRAPPLPRSTSWSTTRA